MVSPVNRSSFVFFCPSMNGISSATGPEPYRISGSPNRASSDATIRSHAIASSQAPARHHPRPAALVRDVVAGRESATCAGEHDHLDVLVALNFANAAAQLADHLAVHRVELVRPVEGDPCR